MKKSTIIWIVAIVVFVGGAIYLYTNNLNSNQVVTVQNQPSVNTSSSTAQTTPPAVAVPIVATASSSKLGTYLTMVSGMTLYEYKNDKVGVSNCSGVCAAIWPPLTVTPNAPLNAASGITGKLGTLNRSDGSVQLTYNGLPLYLYVKDLKPGDANGQNVNGFSVVNP